MVDPFRRFFTSEVGLCTLLYERGLICLDTTSWSFNRVSPNLFSVLPVMKNLRSTRAACLVAASLFGASGSCLANDASEQSQVNIYQATDDLDPIQRIGMSKAHDHYLPSGFYDALENVISEEEYWRQIDYEQEFGTPYVYNKDAERANLKKPVSFLVHPDVECGSNAATRITERGACCGEVHGQSILVNSLPSNCEVITFTDDQCKDDPLDVIPCLNAASGCYSTDAFESVRVDCRPLPL